MAQFLIEWEAPEFEYREKDVSWYWISIIIAVLMIAFAVWERDFLFGFFIIIAEVLVIAWGNQEPKVVSFSLDENRILIGEHRSHSLKEFESWSVEDIGGGFFDLAFNFRAKLRTPLKIMVPEQKLSDIRKDLKLILREVEHHPSLLEAIEKLMKF